MDFRNEFMKYAVKHRGMSSNGVGSYINSVYADYRNGLLPDPELGVILLG